MPSRWCQPVLGSGQYSCYSLLQIATFPAGERKDEESENNFVDLKYQVIVEMTPITTASFDLDLDRWAGALGQVRSAPTVLAWRRNAVKQVEGLSGRGDVARQIRRFRTTEFNSIQVIAINRSSIENNLFFTVQISHDEMKWNVSSDLPKQTMTWVGHARTSCLYTQLD
ncbi:hypothetical protein RRG08_059394 [Elysia crispata]|uniref:Uncharacterized protein n=1 Tax=Elysia crispata TaxID=231223 RepID=A0AAE1E693_9GAST|nr:hypothetical protein RRG08_059394 [Elysia crispata]